MTTTYDAGDDIDAWCNKCKLVLAHVIIAMKAERPARVECKTCSAKHVFKAEAPSTRKRTRKSETTSRRNEYEKLLEGRDISQAQGYKPSVTFREDELLDHKHFGIGIITRALSDRKIEVMFREGMKVLIHAR